MGSSGRKWPQVAPRSLALSRTSSLSTKSLDKLAATDAQAAELVKLHYFAGLTIDQAAAVLGVSARKAYTIWSYARAWLFRCLEGEAADGA